MEKGNFIKHFSVIGVGTIINMIIGVLTTPVITRIVSPEEYGQLSIFTMYSNIFVMVLCLGLDQALVRYYYENKELEYKRDLLFKCIKLPIIISTFFSFILILGIYFHAINFEFNIFISILLCIYTIIQIIYRFSILIIRLEYKSKIYSILNILQKILYIVFAILLILIVKRNYLMLLVIATVSAAGICTILSIIIQDKMWKFFFNKEYKSTVSFKELIKYGYPYIFSMGITTFFQSIDKIFINHYYTYKEVGIYSSAMSMINIFSVIQTTFNTLWTPMAIEHYTKDSEEKTFYKYGNQIITVIMFFIGINLIFVKDIFVIFLGEKYREAAYIFPFLIFNPIMYTISETTGNGIVFKKKSKLQVIIALGACIINIIGNIILVPKLGCKGAAISTGISYIVFFTLRTVVSNKYYYIDFKLKRFYLLTFIVSCYALYNTFFKFNVCMIFSYFICIIVLVYLYRDIIKIMIEYLTKIIIKNKQQKGVKL